jgi:hypothetical protein
MAHNITLSCEETMLIGDLVDGQKLQNFNDPPKKHTQQRAPHFDPYLDCPIPIFAEPYNVPTIRHVDDDGESTLDKKQNKRE